MTANSLISKTPTALLREALLEKFGGKKDFLDFHHRPVEPKVNILDISDNGANL